MGLVFDVVKLSLSPGRRLLVLALAVVASTVVFYATRDSDTPVEQALKQLPEATLTANFTDWSVMRARLGAESLDSASPVGQKDQFFTDAYEADYTAISLLALYEEPMAQQYGWSALDADREMFGQSNLGAVDVLRFSEHFDFDAAEYALTKLGYPPAGDGGVRSGGGDLVAGLKGGLTPALAFIAFQPEERLIVVSDSEAYAALTMQVVRGTEPSVYGAEGVSDLAGDLTGVATGVVHIGSRGCEVAGFDRAGPSDVELASERIKAAGGVHAYSGLAMGIVADDDFVVAMHYSSGDPVEDAAARRVLATGEAPLQGGTFEDRFTITSVDTPGDDLVMTFKPTSPDAQLLSDLGGGGILFATCS